MKAALPDWQHFICRCQKLRGQEIIQIEIVHPCFILYSTDVLQKPSFLQKPTIISTLKFHPYDQTRNDALPIISVAFVTKPTKETAVGETSPPSWKVLVV